MQVHHTTIDETFIGLHDTDEFESFYAANQDELAELGDKSICFALACNCELLIGGGAAPFVRVGFVD